MKWPLINEAISVSDRMLRIISPRASVQIPPAPIRSCDPISYSRFALTRGEIAVAGRAVTNCADCLPGILQDNGPGSVIVKHGTDYLKALFQ